MQSVPTRDDMCCCVCCGVCCSVCCSVYFTTSYQCQHDQEQDVRRHSRSLNTYTHIMLQRMLQNTYTHIHIYTYFPYTYWVSFVLQIRPRRVSMLQKKPKCRKSDPKSILPTWTRTSWWLTCWVSFDVPFGSLLCAKIRPRRVSMMQKKPKSCKRDPMLQKRPKRCKRDPKGDLTLGSLL